MPDIYEICDWCNERKIANQEPLCPDCSREMVNDIAYNRRYSNV